MPNFFAVVKSEHVVAARGMVELYVGAFLGNDRPTFSAQRLQDTGRLGAAPLVQAGILRTLIESGMSRDFSTSSAMAYKASANAFACASWMVLPYAMAPGTSGISAIQRPSVSCSISN